MKEDPHFLELLQGKLCKFICYKLGGGEGVGGRASKMYMCIERVIKKCCCDKCLIIIALP